MCHVLWRDGELKLIGHIASYAIRRGVLTSVEVNSLSSLEWDLDRYLPGVRSDRT
jgi:hypothetical protein